MHQVIHLRVDAPSKPAPGAACNGCGVCCAVEPCPIGQLVSGRRGGACKALEWDETAARYVCGMAAHPAAHLPAGLRWAAPGVARATLRLIASGAGCDSDVTVEVGL